MNAHRNLSRGGRLLEDQPSSAVAALSNSAVISLTTQRKRPRQISWPLLADVRLSEAQLAARADCIGGSDANIILSGAPELVLRLWREKRGQEAPEDLSSRLPVMLGSWTEAFNRQWYEKCTGEEVTRAGESLRCETHPWRGCSLDGFVEAKGAVWEAKHTNGFGKGEDILARYMPQLQHNMAVAKVERALLSVIFGNHKWEVFEVAADWLYQEDLLEAERRFWECVQSGEAPVAVPAPPPPKVVGVREICLQGNNAWAMAAANWLENKAAAQKHAAAGASIKSLIDDDVARAFGHDIEAKRSKAGALTIRELKA